MSSEGIPGARVYGERLAEVPEKELLRRVHDESDPAAREELITRYLPLVRSLARRFSSRGQAIEDLIQVGSIGLIKAIDRFDTSRGVELSTYATPTILGEIKRYFRDKGWAVKVPRALQDLNIRLNRVIEQLTVELNRSPTIPELAKACDATEEEVLEALESGRAYNSLSIYSSGTSEDEDAMELLDFLGAEERVRVGGAATIPGTGHGAPGRSRAADPPPPFLRGHDPDSDSHAGRHLADARIATHPKIHRGSPPAHGGAGPTVQSAQRELTAYEHRLPSNPNT